MLNVYVRGFHKFCELRKAREIQKRKQMSENRRKVAKKFVKVTRVSIRQNLIIFTSFFLTFRLFF